MTVGRILLSAVTAAVAMAGLASAAPAKTQPPKEPPAKTAPPQPAPPPAKQPQTIISTGVVPGFPEVVAKGANPLSESDRKAFAAAFDAIGRRSWPKVQALAKEIRNPLAKKILLWAYLSADETKPGFEELVRFSNENPDWPLQTTMLAKAEKALPEGMPPQRLIAWFAGQEPLTGEGMVRLGQALLANGEVTYGAGWIARAWATQEFDSKKQSELWASYSQYLKGQPSIDRIQMLLWAHQATMARWLIPNVPENWKRIALARIALMESAANAPALVNALPASLKSDPGVMFDEVRYLRRKGKDDEARRKLLAVQNPAQMPNPDKWWIERNVQARKAMDAKEYQDAYDLVAKSGLQRGTEFADAEWLAGWIALRFLDKPKIAEGHFRRLDEGVTYPISSARAEYWLGRALQDAGDKAGAAAAYAKAARFPYTFYGQLSAESPLLSGQVLRLPQTPGVDKAKWNAFLDQELVKAIRLIRDAGEERYVRTLAFEIADRAKDDGELVLLSELLWTFEHPAISLRIAKRASQRQVLLTDYLYPVFELPNYIGGTKPEPALVLGLSRQESEFNPRAVSAAGARGLMQLLPSTAHYTARKHGVAWRQEALLKDPAYNMQLGMAHLGDLLDRFDGSYVLVIAAYNAGSGRVDQWIREMGDPRKKTVDVVDWIERIPFTETRNYVQRVLENTMVYRHRIAGEPAAFILTQDLRRTSQSPLDLSYASRKRQKKAAEPPPIEQITPPDGAPAEPEPLDPKAPATPTMDHDGPAVPPRSEDLDRTPGSSGIGQTGSTGFDEDLPPGTAFLPPGCKTFVLKQNGTTECID